MARKNRRTDLDNETTRDYFSGIAREKRVNEHSNSDKYDEIKKLLLPDKAYSRILECGGGGGFYTRRLLADGYRVTCVDLSEEALRVNTRNAQRLGKAAKLAVVARDFVGFCHSSDQTFDQVLFIKVLHHFDTLENVNTALEGAIEHCRRGGRIIIFEPNGANRLWRLFLSMQKNTTTGKSKWFYEQNMRYTTVPNFVAILDRLQADHEFEYRVGYHYVIPSFILNTGYRGVSYLRRLNRALETTWLKERFSFNISLVIDV